MRAALRSLAEQKKPRALRGLIRRGFLLRKTQARKSSDIPRLNAFCLVAPTVRFSALAIFGAGVFFLARLFKVRTFSADQPRRLIVLFAIKYNSNCDDGEFVAVKLNEEKFKKMTGNAPVDKSRPFFGIEI